MGYLNRAKLVGLDIEFVESSGWFVRTFTIKGNYGALAGIVWETDRWTK